MFISTFAKSASIELSILYCLGRFFPSFSPWCWIYKGFVRPCVVCLCSEVGGGWGGGSTHTGLLSRVESKAFFSSTFLLQLTDFSLLQSGASLHLCSVFCYFYCYCSFKCIKQMLPPIPYLHCTILSLNYHPYSAYLIKARVRWYTHLCHVLFFYLPSTCRLFRRNIKTPGTNFASLFWS